MFNAKASVWVDLIVLQHAKDMRRQMMRAQGHVTSSVMAAACVQSPCVEKSKTLSNLGTIPFFV